MKKVIWFSVFIVGLYGSVAAETVGYFKFDNIQNNQFTDDTGHGLLGTLGVPAGAGAPEQIEGPGGDQAIQIPAGEGLIADVTQFFILDDFAPRTVEMWIKADEFTLSESFAAIYSYGQSSGYRLQLNDDHTFSYVLLGVTQYDTGVMFPFDGEWHHLAIVEDFDNATISMYLDGESVFSTEDYADNELSDNSLL